MKKVLITGGARSGKSSFSLSLAESLGKNRLFLATAQAHDDEMKERIRNHREERGKRFATVEEPVNIEYSIEQAGSKYDVILVDCITVWLGNLFMHYNEEIEEIRKHVIRFADSIEKTVCSVVSVTNEVGNGIVPENGLARRYRDMAGFANQRIAGVSDDVYLCVCGIPSKIK